MEEDLAMLYKYDYSGCAWVGHKSKLSIDSNGDYINKKHYFCHLYRDGTAEPINVHTAEFSVGYMIPVALVAVLLIAIAGKKIKE
jgi:hypothetical protein